MECPWRAQAVPQEAFLCLLAGCGMEFVGAAGEGWCRVCSLGASATLGGCWHTTSSVPAPVLNLLPIKTHHQKIPKPCCSLLPLIFQSTISCTNVFSLCVSALMVWIIPLTVQELECGPSEGKLRTAALRCKWS